MKPQLVRVGISFVQAVPPPSCLWHVCVLSLYAYVAASVGVSLADVLARLRLVVGRTRARARARRTLALVDGLLERHTYPAHMLARERSLEWHRRLRAGVAPELPCDPQPLLLISVGEG